MRVEDAGAEDPAEREAVEWYFGDLVEEIARDWPIGRGRLLGALARLEAATATTEVPGKVCHHGPEECVIALKDPQWTKLCRDAGLTDLEAATTRAVHQRMAAALGEPQEDEVPVVLVRSEIHQFNEPVNRD